jgi:hypothetical protein
MSEQYEATDKRTGLQVTVTGDFPEDPEDRVRIARTCTLFTRLMATILDMDATVQRRDGFRAVETQLEIADALLQQDMAEVQRLIRETLSSMGVSEAELSEIEMELRRQLDEFGSTDQPPPAGV